jgi:hypothetical protein
MYIVDFSFSWRRNLVERTDVWPVARCAGLAAAHNFFAAYNNLTRNGVTARSVFAAVRQRNFRTVPNSSEQLCLGGPPGAWRCTMPRQPVKCEIA